eukprot:COSAG05_NODE_437_length_9835_cov_3.761915_2_plen_135_part_00
MKQGPLLELLGEMVPELTEALADPSVELDLSLEGDQPRFKYDSQVAPNQLVMVLRDSGEVEVPTMIDTLDLLMSWMIGSALGEIAATAQPTMNSFHQYLRALVRTKTSFTTLSTLASLAMSLLPALQKAAFAVK